MLAGGGGGGSRGGSAAADAAAGTIIVETNYRVGLCRQQFLITDAVPHLHV